ncbi:MAG TPA: RNA 2'-phosphotransferase [Chitinophagaceae bacterium]|nr:RNA 2'-phosphotransferase [Chitinophagaceae bacterium]
MINETETKKLSKLLSYVLRHNPAHLGLHPDPQGWVSVEVLLKELNKQQPISFEQLKYMVDTNSKKRFSFNESFTMLRASQGHSIEIELNYTPQAPPPQLFHGTAEKNLPSILENGLTKMQRHHVHLSADKKTALQVGQRHGKPVALIVEAMAMHDKGHLFYISDNGVWLTDHVPVEFITIP